LRGAERGGVDRVQAAQAAVARGYERLQAGAAAAAEAAFREALELDRASAPALSGLATLARQAGRHEEAVKLCQRAVRAAPDAAELRHNLGVALEAAGEAAAAEAAYREAIRLDPGFGRALANLGVLLGGGPRAAEGVGLLERGVALEPANLLRRRALKETRGRMVPEWHFPMMNDTSRNRAYARAIARAVRPGMHVLDIGTGSGLLAMLAVRAGAAHVTACEMVAPVAAAARDIVRLNGLADRITVVARRSTELRIGRDMVAPADLLVSEILSSEFVGEGVVATLRDAHARLLHPGARSIPKGGAVLACLAGGAALAGRFAVGEVEGFDLAPFNRLRRSAYSVDLRRLGFAALSPAATLFRLDYPFAEGPPARFAPHFAVAGAGTAFGIAQWIAIDLDERETFANDPRQPDDGVPSGWQHIFYPFDAPLAVRPGQRVAVDGLCDGSNLILDAPRLEG